MKLGNLLKVMVLLLMAFALTWHLPSTGAAQAKKPVTVDDLMKIKSLYETQISPDGAQVLYVVCEPDLKESLLNTDVWMVRYEGGAPVKLTNGAKRDDTPRWSPDGKQVAFISDRDGKPQVWLIDPRGGEASKLTDAKAGVASFAWSPDGRRVAYLAPDPPTDEEEKKQKERDDTLLVDQNLKMTHLHVIGVEGRDSRQLTKGNFNVTSLSWSPDGKQIAFAFQPTPKAPDAFRSDISVVALEDGKVRKLVEREGLDASPQWSPDGATIAFDSNEDGIDWIGNTYLCVVPAAGGAPRNLSKAFDENLSDFAWSADSKTIYASAIQRVTTQLFAVSAETGNVTKITAGDRVYGGFSFSRTGRMAFLAQTPEMPAEVHVSSLAKFEPVKLTTTNPQIAGLALGKTEVIRWKSNDGMEIEGLLIKPVGFEAGKRYPLLTYVHGGPSGVFMLSFTPQLGFAPIPLQAEPYPLQVFAGQGYAILCPNPRGSGGHGEKFRRANVKDWGFGDYNDIMSGIDHLIKQGIADPDKLGIMGWSYGGYMTSWVITQTDRFKAASVGAGVTNLYSMYGTTDISEFLDHYFGAKPWNDIEIYKRHSAMFHAGKIKTPTLIQHGEKDERVPLSQGQELYIALRMSNVPVEFAVYPRQGHLIMEPRLQADMLSRNLNWFNRWLKGNAP
ncbi:MAG TPA: S9 family peptidase [Blastocatellia bacterium]|nr:S9 family peptidase [Blastocatellia bacterium]